MARLRRGFEIMREQSEEQADERVSSTRGAARHPNRTAPGRARSGDKAALNEFASKHNLRKN